MHPPGRNPRRDPRTVSTRGKGIRCRHPPDLAGHPIGAAAGVGSVGEPGVLRRIGRDHPGLQTLTAYAAGLLRGLIPVATSGLAELARGHLAELLAFIVREPDLQANGPVPSQRGLRIQALKAEVEQRLGSPDLSLDTVARAQRISSRLIQAMFQAEGETFSGFVLARRLDRAMERLTDGDDARPIGAIAFDVGFGDLSYFNRTFRRRFGLTPTQARRVPRRAERFQAVAAERVWGLDPITARRRLRPAWRAERSERRAPFTSQAPERRVWVLCSSRRSSRPRT